MSLFSKTNPNSIYAVANGDILPLSQVPDEVFSTGVLGEGVAQTIAGDTIVSPADGVISMLPDTLHAFGLRLDNGAELLVHIGLDTVGLKGKGFTSLAKLNQRVKKGAPIIRVDREYVEGRGYKTTTMIIATDPAGHTFAFEKEGKAKKGRSVVGTIQS